MATSNQPVSAPVQGAALPSRAAIVKATREAQLPAGVIPPAARALIEERRARTKIAAAIRGTMWGKDLGADGSMALAAYCARNSIDALRHVDILGGRIYLNANYYQEQGAQLIHAGKVRAIDVEHVEHDPRLEDAYQQRIKWAEEVKAAGDAELAGIWRASAWKARQELERRRDIRIELGAKEKASAVVRVRIWLPGLDEPIVGWNECGNGIRKDPIGDERPAATAETRAARRAWRQLVAAFPTLAPKVAAAEEEGAALEDVIDEGRRLTAESEAAQPLEQDGTAIPMPADPYLDGTDVTKLPKATIVPSGLATLTDDEDLALDRQLAADDAAAERRR
jgi:hypothetical protein